MRYASVAIENCSELLSVPLHEQTQFLTWRRAFVCYFVRVQEQSS